MNSTAKEDRVSMCTDRKRLVAYGSESFFTNIRNHSERRHSLFLHPTLTVRLKHG